MVASDRVDDAGGGSRGGATGPRLGMRDLLGGGVPTGLVPNAWFMPSAAAMPAHEAFAGTLSLSEARMGVASLSPSSSPVSLSAVAGKDPEVFPAVDIGFFSEADRLVPVTQEVLRVGSLPGGTSYWDVLVQPGRVWAEPGDDGWSRASFPFALVHSVEGETHTGIATFLYGGQGVSPLRFQIVQQTLPYRVEPCFSAWGATAATYAPGGIADLEQRRAAWRAELNGWFPTADWQELERRVGQQKLGGFDDRISADAVLVRALVYEGTLYRGQCATAAGPFPYTDEMRFGVWSVTKSAANAVALFRLAQKYGTGILEERICEYVLEAADYPGWHGITFFDLAHMASGHGFGSLVSDPNDIFSGYTEGDYDVWCNATTKAAKVARALDQPVFPWAPGTVARYRDQDAFLLGVAMDAYLKRRQGEGADLWDMMRDEVLSPIGVVHAPMNRTVEADGSAGQPIMGYGLYATLADLARIALLLQRRGAWGGAQLLCAELVDQVLCGPAPRGLATGTPADDGEELYSFTFYMAPYLPASGELTYVPSMRGWGSNLVVLLPGEMVALRMARLEGDDPAGEHTTPMARIAERLGAFAGSAPDESGTALG